MHESYLDSIDDTISRKYLTLEKSVMEDVVRRIQKTGEITATADWQLYRLYEMGSTTEELERVISSAVGDNKQMLEELYQQALNDDYMRMDDLYKAVGKDHVPFTENQQFQQVLKAQIENSNSQLQNISRTTNIGFSIEKNGQRQFVSANDYVNDKIDKAMLQIMSGTFDYNKALKDIVSEMTKSGLRTIDYASGRSNRVDVAARRAVMTGINQVTGHVAKMNAQLLNTDLYEVSWHVGARPSHSVWQGKVYKWEDLEDVCGLSEPDGLLGANCRHTYYPFIDGVSERTYDDEWLEEMNEKENTPVEYGDKEYTLYEATQRQRQLETAMRAESERVRLLRAGKGSDDDIMLARCKYQALLNEYKDFSSTMGLRTQMERVRIASDGRIASGQKQLQKAIDEGKIKPTTASSNVKTAISDYNRNKEAIDKTLKDVWKETLRENKRDGTNIEYGYVINLRGGIASRTQGTEKYVSPPSEIQNFNIFTHNHPSGSPPSPQDLKAAVENNLFGLVSTTEDGKYYMLIRNGASLDTSFSGAYIDGAAERAGTMAGNMLNAGLIKTEDEAVEVAKKLLKSQEVEWLEENAEKYGYQFITGKYN